MPSCLCRKCHNRSQVISFPAVCKHCDYLLTERTIVEESEAAKVALRAYCIGSDINPDGQFIEQDGYLFTDGYEIGLNVGKAWPRKKEGCNPCNCGSCDQTRSDRSFYTKQLFKKASEFLAIDPENTSWFEVMDLMEKEIKALRYDLQVAHSVINANKDQTNGKTE